MLVQRVYLVSGQLTRKDPTAVYSEEWPAEGVKVEDE